MSNSHTPGPWRVARHGKDGQEIIVESTVARTPEFDDGCGDYFPVVADLYRGGTGNIHDATLIAAAPDMLAALRRAVLALAFAAQTSPAMHDDYNAVSKAIAKATGATHD